MIIKNNTSYEVAAALRESVAGYPVDGLVVELKYCREGSRRYISGNYYLRTKGFENGKLIRVRINRANKYPMKVPFKTSSYFTRRNARGEEIKYQRLRTVEFHRAEDMILGIFLHEFSHYLDHMQGLNGRYKQTKADKFATSILERMGIIEEYGDA